MGNINQFERRMRMSRMIFRAKKRHNKGLSFNKLAEYFNVSVRTIKKDISELETYFSFKHNETGVWFIGGM